MNKLKVFLTVALTLVLSVSAVYALTVNMSVDELKQLTSNDTFGAMASPDHYQRQYFHAGYQSGGSVYSTSSTAATFTLLSANFDGDVTYVDWTPNVSTTITTMASTSMYWLGETPGDERSYWFRNASSTATASITFAAGTGVDLQDNEDSADLALLGLDLMKLTFIRKADSDVLLVLDEYTEAD